MWLMNVLEKGTLFTHPIEKKETNKIKRFLSHSQHNEEATEMTTTEGSKSDISCRWLQWLESHILRQQHDIHKELTAEHPTQPAVGTGAFKFS